MPLPRDIEDPSPKLRILLVRLSSIGDLVHTLPALVALREAYPQAVLHCLVERRCRDVIADNPLLDRILEVDTLRWRRRPLSPSTWRDVIGAVRGLREERYDLVLDLQGTLKSAVAGFLARSPRRVGFESSHLRERAAVLFYDERVRPGEHRHVIDWHLELLRALGISTEASARRFPIVVPDAMELVAEEWLRPLGDYVVLNPAASWATKRWEPERFGRLAREIAREWQLESLVLWGPGEERLAERVVEASGGAATLAPKTGVRDMLPYLRRARLIVSGDTGPMHFGSALGVPVVGIFGPTDPGRNGPFGSEDRVIWKDVDCGPCYRKRCPGYGNVCMTSITEEEVLEAVRALLRVETSYQRVDVDVDARSS